MSKRTNFSRRVLAGLTAGVLALSNLPATAHAAEPPFQVDLDVVTDHLLAAQAQIHDGGQPGLVRLVLSAEFLEWRRQHASASALEAYDHLSARYDALTDALTPQDAMLPESDYVLRLASVVVADPEPTAASAPHIRDLVEAILGKSVTTFDTREDLVSGSLRGSHWLRTRSEVEAAIYSAVRRRAIADDGFAYAWNGILGQPAEIDATATLAQLKADPTLQQLVNVDAILALQASRPAFLAEVQRQFGLVAAALSEESEQARARLAALSATCPVKPDASCSPQQRAAAEAAAKAEQKEIDGAAAAAKLLGGLAKIADLKAGEKIEKVATAWYSIITAINKYATAVAGRSAADAILSGASVVLAGDILGAVMTLVGLLGDSGPSLDQQILSQIAELRQEVRALHQEMRESFQRIELQLNTIFVVMLNEFDKLSGAIAGNTAALIDIQNQLAEQELRLESVAATILAAIGDVELHDARADVNQYIGYADTYGQSIPTFGEYIGPENEFHYAATEIATHAAFVVPPSLASDPTVSPTQVLDNYGESNALSYLARLGRARDPRVLDPVDVFANPSVWNFSAQAWALLALQNAGYASQVSPSRRAQIELEGQRILDGARSFSRPADLPDATGDRTNPIFTTLVAEYRDALVRLGNGMSAIRRLEIQTRKEPLDAQGTSFVTVPKNYGLFFPANQTIPTSVLPENPLKLGKCTPTASNPQLVRPANVNFASLAPELRFAHYAFSPSMQDTMRLPQISQCYDVTFTGYREVTTTIATSEYARLRLTMRTRFRWAPDEAWRNARSATYTWPEMRISYVCHSHCTANSHTTLEEALIARWPRDKALFEQSATLSVDNDLVNTARAQMTAFLQGRQRTLYQRVAADIFNANTTLNLAVADLDDAARQLQAYTRLGFPIALGGDDILSSLLFGDHSLPVNAIGNTQIDRTYNIAFNAYACSPAAGLGTPCTGGPFLPLRDQPHLDIATSTNPSLPVFCAAQTWAIPGLPGDPVGDCLIGSATERLDGLAGRYRHHSQLLSSGVYVEQLPWIASTLATLPLVDTIVRTEESN